MVELLPPAIAGVWLYLTFGRGRFWRTAPLLQPPPPLPAHASSCRVAVVIPARNEAATISFAVHSLLTQDWPGKLVVFVADDGSDDGTGELAAQAGAQVVTARPLPSGWSGKVWALSEGLSRAQEIQP